METLVKRQYTEAEKGRVLAAVFAVHETVCPVRHEHKNTECLTARSLANWATLHALESLDANRNDAAAVRVILHDACCMSGCEGAEAADHAKRTQSKNAAALRAYHRDEKR